VTILYVSPSRLSVIEPVSTSKGFMVMPSPGSETLELDESHAKNVLAEITANIPLNQNLPIVLLFIKNKIQKKKWINYSLQKMKNKVLLKNLRLEQFF